MNAGSSWGLWPCPGTTRRSAPSALLERVADRVEGRMVRARDDERGEVQRGEALQRDLGLPRPALVQQRPRAALERRRERRGRLEVRSHRDEERAQERLGVAARPVAPEAGASLRERGHRRVVERDARARRLDHRQRRELGPALRRCQERDHAPVGVADQVVAGLQPRRDPGGMALEVDRVVLLVAEPRPLEDDELGRRGVDRAPLLAPGRAAADDAAVHEHEPGRCLRDHVTNLADFGFASTKSVSQAR